MQLVCNVSFCVFVVDCSYFVEGCCNLYMYLRKCFVVLRITVSLCHLMNILCANLYRIVLQTAENVK